MMQFWKKDKETRIKTWHIVNISNRSSEVEEWISNHESDGKYYHYFASANWWFELPEDAMMFKLRWS